ncbi:MAG: serine hydrolase domain-containing protein [Candidatus Nanopelagicales bacterium]
MVRVLSALVLSVVAALPTAPPAGPVEAVIDQEMPASGVPGVAYAVVTDGEITAAGARGVMEAGGDAAVTPDTPFLSGSISKSFTALAVMQLVEAGRVDLDAPVSRYLDTFTGTPAGVVTIRQLLSHTSGFSTLQGNADRGASEAYESDGTDALQRRVQALADVAPDSPPGTTWQYSNLNYVILGRLVEVLSGQDYQSYVTAMILEPVGMTHSVVADGEVHDSMATGHTPWFWTKRPLTGNPTDRGTAPQGGIVASATDLARYLQMMMNGRDDVVSAASKTMMMQPAGDLSPFYGFGWFVDTADGTVWHSGTSPGFESLATMIPDEGKAAVVLVNGGSGVGFGETAQLRNAVTAAALGMDYDGEGSRLPQQLLFLGLLLLPLAYLVSMVWAWRHRGAVRAKSEAGLPGLFSLWFPLLTTVVAGWVVVALVPDLLGAPLATIRVFQPDLALALVATALTGVIWAVFRLVVAYTGRPASG